MVKREMDKEGVRENVREMKEMGDRERDKLKKKVREGEETERGNE